MKKLIIGLAAVIIVLAVAVGAIRWITSQGPAPTPGPGAPGGNSQGSQAQEAKRNPEGCSDYELIAAPGTWESAPTDDPANPTSHPNSLLLGVTKPLQAQVPPDQLKVWTLPYAAQFRNFNAPAEMPYDQSRDEGFAKISAEMSKTAAECPASKFILVGFSQGAVITGDLASEIGNGRGPVPADRIAGVALIADGRQERAHGRLIGSQAITGTGAEIALAPVSGLIQGIVPGATMRGPRPGGFGVLNDRVNNYCAVQDLVCDAPLNLGNAVQRAQDLVAANAVHAQYAFNNAVVPGQTVPQHVVAWATELANQPL